MRADSKAPRSRGSEILASRLFARGRTRDDELPRLPCHVRGSSAQSSAGVQRYRTEPRERCLESPRVVAHFESSRKKLSALGIGFAPKIKNAGGGRDTRDRHTDTGTILTPPTSPIEEHVTVQEEGTEHFEHLEPRFGVRESQLWTIDVQEERKCHLDRAAACRRSS